MTKAEKIGIFFSAAALIISIISPIATYIWLDPNIKAFKDRARLQTHGNLDYVFKEKPASSGSTITYGTLSYELDVLNTGKSPAKEIQIVLLYEGPIPENFLTFEPLTQFELHNIGTQYFITIKRPIPAQGSLKVTFNEPPKALSVSTEWGETSSITIDTNETKMWLRELEKYPEDKRKHLLQLAKTMSRLWKAQ